MRDSEPKRAYNAVGCVRYGAHVMMNFRMRKFAGFCVIRIRKTKWDGIQWIPSHFVWRALRDSEPKRAYYVVGCVRHDAHVMKNFCEQKFFGGSSYSENEKQKRMISVGYHPLLFGVP